MAQHEHVHYTVVRGGGIGRVGGRETGGEGGKERKRVRQIQQRQRYRGGENE